MVTGTIDSVRPTVIANVVQESSNIRTLIFRDDPSLQARAGQFSMIWLPGVGEFPMSISLPHPDGMTGITIKAMGAGSNALYYSPKGSVIGVRGPYGIPFEIGRSKRVLLVGGGTGMAPLILLAHELSGKKAQTKMVIGARSKAELPFLETVIKILGKSTVFPSTDDGSLGFHGLAHQKVQDLVDDYKFDLICSCGPEAMMRAVYEIARSRRIPMQFSLERIMKCGMGICGSCSLGDLVLCKDGPVLDQASLERVSNEFGHFKRDKAGKLCPI